jgi:hypothetical protein
MCGWWEQLRKTPDAYLGYVQMEYGDYLEKMAKSAVYKPLFLCMLLFLSYVSWI